MIAEFFVFDKRNNSTKQPSIGSGTSIEIKLKDQVSLLEPILFVEIDGVPPYNYCYFDNSYYYIDDRVSIRNGLWEFHLSIDHLATFKANIANTYAFIEYATQSYNTLLSDTRIPFEQKTNVEKVVGSTSGFFDTDGVFRLNTAGIGIGTIGGFTKSYAMDTTTLTELARVFFTNDDMSGELIKWFTSPYDCLIDCSWFPLSAMIGTPETIALGGYDTEVTAVAITQRGLDFTITLDIPWKFSDWRNMEPITTMVIYLPFIGMVPLSAGQFYGSNTMRVELSVDCLGGDVCYSIYRGDSTRIGTYKGQASVDIPIASQKTGSIKQLATASAQNIVDVVTGWDSSVFMSPTPSGQFGGIAGAWQGMNVELYLYYHNTSMTPTDGLAIQGCPVGKVMQIGSINGYVQCRDASVSIPGGKIISERINANLRGGIYFE